MTTPITITIPDHDLADEVAIALAFRVAGLRKDADYWRGPMFGTVADTPDGLIDAVDMADERDRRADGLLALITTLPRQATPPTGKDI